MYELLGRALGWLLIAWLVLPIILWMLQAFITVTIVLIALVNETTATCSYLGEKFNTQPSFNGYIPKDRNHSNIKPHIIARDDNIPIV
jgi:hypothetical protein